MENFRSLITKDSAEYAINQLEAIANDEPICEFDAELKTFAGNRRFVRFKWTVGKGHEKDYKKVYLSTTDLTERIIDENLLLQKSNREKAILLKEVHHRVKNNLQIISSLLNLQSRGIENEKIRHHFEVSLNRIHSMSAVHEMLYKSSDFSKINYEDYLKNLVLSLLVSMKGSDNAVDVDISASDINLNIQTSIPLGLLINEIITNALKHGIPGNSPGKIFVYLKQNDTNKYELEVGDNGNGFDRKEATTDSLGMQLIDSLTEQLNGELSCESNGAGTHYRVIFEELIQRNE